VMRRMRLWVGSSSSSREREGDLYCLVDLKDDLSMECGILLFFVF